MMKRIPAWRLGFAAAVIAAMVAAVVVQRPGMSSAASPDLGHRVAIPGLAFDASSAPTDTPTPTPVANDSRVTLADISTTFLAGLTIYGDVENGTGTTISDVMIHGTAYGSDGSVLAERDVEALVEEVPAGGSVPFRVVFPSVVPANAQYTVTVTSYQSAVDPVSPDLRVTSTQPAPVPIFLYDPDTDTRSTSASTTTSQVTGTVTNSGSRELGGFQGVLVVKDGSGHVVMVVESAALATPSKENGLPVLHPGETGTFTITFPTADYLSIAGTPTVAVYVSMHPLEQ
jgi:hypothetical protein